MILTDNHNHPPTFQDLILILICLAKLSIVEEKDHYRVLDFFSGRARVARIARKVGLASVAVDKDYCDGDNYAKTNSMDLNTDAGFLLLAQAPRKCISGAF